MMSSDLTFVFDEDGKARAVKEGQVVASANTVEELEAIVKEADLLGDIGNAAKGVGNAVGDAAKAVAQPGGIPGQALQQGVQSLQNLDQHPNLPPGVNPALNQPLNNPGQPGPSDPTPRLNETQQEFLDRTQPNLPSTPAPIPKVPRAPLGQPNLKPMMSAKKETSCDCWDGYERVPGTKPCSEGSCRKCDDHRKKEKASATHVVTPNGLRGKILGKTKDVWGDTVTVRFENGRIVQFPVSDNLRFAKDETEEESLSKVASLRNRLNTSVDPDRRSLVARIDELKAIRREAAGEIANGTSHEDEQELDIIALQAKTEIDQVVAALEHLADVNTEPFQAFESQVVEQASLGGNNDSTWLDDTFGKMVSEANATDYDQLMDEGPEEFVAGLEHAALADAGVVREMASSYVRTKTAGANPNVRETFESAWIERVESLRREELKNRKIRAKKEAAAEDTDTSNLPDDILFG